MSSVQVTCTACRTSLRLPAEQLGKRIRCPKCKNVFQTHPTDGAAVAPTEAPLLIPVPTPPAEDDNPFAFSEESSNEANHPKPVARQSRPTTKSGGQGKLVALIAGGAAILGLILIGGVIAIIAAMRVEPEPTPTVAEQPRPSPSPQQRVAAPVEPETTSDGRMTEKTLDRVKASTVYIRTFYPDKTASTGSGFFAAAPGLVVTNAHVVGQSPRGVRKVEAVEVVVNSGLQDEATYPAQVLKADRLLDLALLKVADINTPPLEVIDAFYLKETQAVYIFGFPGGEELGTNISVNTSTISSLRRDEVVPWIQVAGGMHKGNSGGPVTDATGKVIGVARATIAGTQINMAIPGDVVHSFFHNAGNLIPKRPNR